MHYDIEEIFGGGAPLSLQFTFLEWLAFCQLGSLKRVLMRQQQQLALDKFLQEAPDLRPSKGLLERSNASESSPESPELPLPTAQERPRKESAPLVTETLAQVYRNQKKHQLALQVYHQLRLDFPEKSTYFARLIRELKAERV